MGKLLLIAGAICFWCFVAQAEGQKTIRARYIVPGDKNLKPTDTLSHEFLINHCPESVQINPLYPSSDTGLPLDVSVVPVSGIDTLKKDSLKNANYLLLLYTGNWGVELRVLKKNKQMEWEWLWDSPLLDCYLAGTGLDDINNDSIPEIVVGGAVGTHTAGQIAYFEWNKGNPTLISTKGNNLDEIGIVGNYSINKSDSGTEIIKGHDGSDTIEHYFIANREHAFRYFTTTTPRDTTKSGHKK